MNKTKIIESHQKQIRYLLTGHYRKLLNEVGLFRSVDRIMKLLSSIYYERTAAYVFWVESGNQDNSIFANVPGCSGCLSQIKSWHMTSYETHADSEMTIRLGLEDNDLIIAEPPRNWNPTKEELQEFSRLQIEARWPT